MKKKGIYAIVFDDKYAYVGQSVDLESRKREHFRLLSSCSHPNFSMVTKFDKKDFEFLVLKEVLDNSLLNGLESSCFDELSKKYEMVNVRPCGVQGVAGCSVEYENVDFRLRFVGNSLFVGDKEISMRDGMYCFSDLIDYLISHSSYSRNLSEVVNGKTFVDRINACYHSDIPYDRQSVRHLKDMGIYKTIGKGDNRRIYCDFKVFLTIAIETCPMMCASCLILIADNAFGLTNK